MRTLQGLYSSDGTWTSEEGITLELSEMSEEGLEYVHNQLVNIIETSQGIEKDMAVYKRHQIYMEIVSRATDNYYQIYREITVGTEIQNGLR